MYLPSEAFRPKGGMAKINMRGVVGLKDETPWYAPGPKHVPVEHADHALLEEVFSENKVDSLKNLWLNVLLDQDSCLIVRKRARALSPEGPWMISLGQTPGTACVAWPADIVDSPVESRLAFRPETNPEKVKELCFICILELDMWEGVEVKWMSPMHAWIINPAYDNHGYGITAVATSHPRPLQEIAAENAFWAED